MRRGFRYLVAIMERCSCKILACRLSNAMEAEFCVAALEEAITRSTTPRAPIPRSAPGRPMRSIVIDIEQEKLAAKSARTPP